MTLVGPTLAGPFSLLSKSPQRPPRTSTRFGSASVPTPPKGETLAREVWTDERLRTLRDMLWDMDRHLENPKRLVKDILRPLNRFVGRLYDDLNSLGRAQGLGLSDWGSPQQRAKTQARLLAPLIQAIQDQGQGFLDHMVRVCAIKPAYRPDPGEPDYLGVLAGVTIDRLRSQARHDLLEGRVPGKLVSMGHAYNIPNVPEQMQQFRQAVGTLNQVWVRRALKAILSEGSASQHRLPASVESNPPRH